MKNAIKIIIIIILVFLLILGFREMTKIENNVVQEPMREQVMVPSYENSRLIEIDAAIARKKANIKAQEDLETLFFCSISVTFLFLLTYKVKHHIV